MSISPPTHDLVRSLADVSSEDLETAGGKGSSLGALIRAGLPVPAGFVVTTAAYRAALGPADSHGDEPDAAARAEALRAVEEACLADPVAIAAAAERLRTLDMAVPLPAALVDQVATAYAALGPDVPVAVRSSATAEDLDEASFAGQQETFLNVVGTQDLLAAIKGCWASLWSAPAVTYRRRVGIPSAEVAMAVVVQCLVSAERAGVLFTADPVSGARDRLVIDAAWGLGEALVSGQVTPDHVVVDRSSGTVLNEVIADKHVMTVPGGSGVSLTDVAPERRHRRVLETRHLDALRELAGRVEELLGRPADIEWVITDDEVSLVQARPITTLPPDLLGMEWSRQMLIERYPDPLTPLTWSAVSNTFFASLRSTMTALGGTLPDDVPMIQLIHGRAYVNVTAMQQGMQSLPLRPPVASQGPAGAATDGAAGRARRAPTAQMARAAAGLGRLVLGTHREWERLAGPYAAGVRDWRHVDWASRSTADLRAARRTQAAALTPLLDNHARAIVAADLTVQLLGSLTKRWLDDVDGTGVLTLLSGLSGNRTVETNRALWRLAQIGPVGPGFDEALAQFLDAYGHRSPRYEFAHPTWGEDPDQVLDLVRVIGQESPDPAQGEAARRAAREEATSRARRLLPLPRRLVFTRVLSLAQTYFRLRENQQFVIVMGVPPMRGIVVELGRRFVAAGWLGAADEVFLLETDEIDALAAALDEPHVATEPRRLVQDRKAALERYRQTPAPVHLGGAAGTVKRPDPAQEGRLVGIAASTGCAVGPARIVRSPQDFGRVRAGDVLVAPATSPGWTPLFGLAAGLVTQFGGLLSHAGVVAREYGLPAVLGVPDLLDRVRDGDLVTLDGSTGIVAVQSSDQTALAST
jgi:phosphohistidine swiveling domain-containing protein